jgi:hypothetical protein
MWGMPTIEVGFFLAQSADASSDIAQAVATFRLMVHNIEHLPHV